MDMDINKNKNNNNKPGCMQSCLVSSLMFIILILVIANIWFIKNKKLAGPSSTNVPGQLLVYFTTDSPPPSRSRSLALTFSKKDYDALSDSLISLRYPYGEYRSDNSKNLVNLGRYNFVIVNSKAGLVSIAYDENNYAHIMPRNNVHRFVEEYNGIIRKCNYKLEINDNYDQDILNYTDFISDIFSVGGYEEISTLKTKFVNNDNVATIHYQPSYIDEEIVTVKMKYAKFRKLKELYRRPRLIKKKDKLLLQMDVIDTSTFRTESLKLRFITLSIDKNGLLSVEEEQVLSLPLKGNLIEKKLK